MHKFLIIVIVVVPGMFGCSAESTSIKDIENASSDTLRYLLFRNGGTISDTVLLFPGMSKHIAAGTLEGANREAPQCNEFIDSAWFDVLGGGSVTKLIQENDNWELVGKQTKNIPVEYEYTCTFTIRDSDIAD